MRKVIETSAKRNRCLAKGDGGTSNDVRVSRPRAAAGRASAILAIAAISWRVRDAGGGRGVLGRDGAPPPAQAHRLT